jgi:Tfp pilus assembly protein FimT
MTSCVRGATLLDLLVVLALLGIIAAVAGVGGRTGSSIPAMEDVVATARREAVRSAQPVTRAVVTGDGTTIAVTAHPDGKVIGHPRWDPMPGSPRGALP